MAANLKSHVLSRDEKGFGGVPFKRLLLGGVSGGFAYTLLRFTAANIAIPVGIFVALQGIILTSLRGGLPLWLRLWLHLRGKLLLSATANPSGLSKELAQLFNVPVELAHLDGAQIFAPPAGLSEIDLREWVTFAQSRDVDRDEGLVFVDAPISERDS